MFMIDKEHEKRTNSVYVRTCISVCVSVCVLGSLFVCVCICMYVCVCVRFFIHVYVYVCSLALPTQSYSPISETDVTG
jgi:uncharacterized membrane protein YeiH